MNKKLAMLGLGVAVGSMMLVTSVYAGVGEAPGYEAFKTAVKQTATIKNVTRQVNVSLQDNGASLLQVKSTIKTGGADQVGSAQVQVQGSGAEQQTIQFYSQDGKQIIKTADSDVYKVIEGDNAPAKFNGHNQGTHTPNPEVISEVENVVDALVGNLKNYVTMDDAAGNGKEIHFKLSGSQISPVVNTVGSLLIKHGTKAKDEPVPAKANTLGIDLTTLKNSLPQLASDISMDEVEVNASVDSDDHITSQSAQIHLSGKDEQGAEHDVVLRIDMTLSSLNSTTPDTVDLSGKQVENVKFDEMSGHKKWGDKN